MSSKATIRERAPARVGELQAAGWLTDVDPLRIERVVEAAVRDLRRRRSSERGALERDLLLLDPRTRNAAFPESLTGEPFDVMLPTWEGAVLPIPVQVDLPEGGSGVSTWRLRWGDGERRIVLRSHDGLYNRGLAVRGVNKLLESGGAPWRYHEVLVGAIPVVLLTGAEDVALQRLLDLDWVSRMPAKGQESPVSEGALERAEALRDVGVLHQGLGEDLVRRAFSGPRRFLDGLEDDLLGNHVAVLDGLSVLHVDSVRTFDEERHEDFANALFRIGGDAFAGAEVTDLDSTPTDEGPTELDFEWGDDEFRIHFEQESGVIELRIVHALNSLLAERADAHEGRFHALAPVSHVEDADPVNSLLITFLLPEQVEALRTDQLVRFSSTSLDPSSLRAEERLRTEVI